MTLSPRAQRGALITLLVVLGAVFVVRGPVRAVGGGADLMHLYAASTLWLDGGNPYDGQQCVQTMRQAGLDDPEHVANGSFYPPPTLAALSPLGLLDWDAARLVWLAINLGCCAVLAWALSVWLRLASAGSRWLVALVVLLAWGPAMTALWLGQLSIAAAASVFAGLILLDRGKAVLPGLLLAVGCLIKPQLGLGFLVLIALRRQWLTLAVAAAVLVVVTGIGIGRVMMTTPGWAEQLAANIASDQAPGQVLDASLDGPMRFQMSDLRPLLHLVLPGGWVNLAALLFTALLALTAIVRLLQLGLDRHKLLAIAGVGLLILLPVYHRTYDAMMLLPLLTLVINALVRDRRDRWMGVIALTMLPLFLPLPPMLARLHQKGMIPDALHNAWPWQHVVLQHQSWCLLIASIALVVWTWRLPLSSADPSEPQPLAKDGPA